MKKIISLMAMISLLITITVGCSDPTPSPEPKPSKTPVETIVEEPDDPKVESPSGESKEEVNLEGIEVVMTDSLDSAYSKEVTTEVDLNGDGVKDKIVLKTYQDEYGYDQVSQYDLFVNDQQINEEGESINPMFNIVDINKEDGFLEIAISEEGASSDYSTAFFRYDGEKLTNLAKIQGYYGKFPDVDDEGDMIIDGSGTVITTTRGEILQTWFYEDRYELRENDEFVNIRKDLYPMETEVTMLKDLKTVKKRDSTKEAFILKTGEKATILETDNKYWVSIRNAAGEIGWFYTQGYDVIYGQDQDFYGSDYFEGLSMAD